MTFFLPIALLGGLFFFSKELIVVNYQLIIIIGLFIIFSLLINQLSKAVTNFLNTYKITINEKLQALLLIKLELLNETNFYKNIKIDLEGPNGVINLCILKNESFSNFIHHDSEIKLINITNNVFNLIRTLMEKEIN